MSSLGCLDFSSLYPDAAAVNLNFVSPKPMSPPSGILHYMDFWWFNEFSHIPGAIHININDTFDNILDLLETPDIIVAKLLDCKIDTLFVGNSIFSWASKYYNKLGVTGEHLKSLLADSLKISSGDPRGDEGEDGGKYIQKEPYDPYLILRTTLIKAEFILFAPQTPFVKKHAIGKYEDEDENHIYTCKELIDEIFRKRRGH